MLLPQRKALPVDAELAADLNHRCFLIRRMIALAKYFIAASVRDTYQFLATMTQNESAAPIQN